VNLLEALEQTRLETLEAFDTDEAQLDLTYGAGKWTVREILHHLSDAETVLFDRIRRVISEPRQVLWAFDQTAWATGLGYLERPVRLSAELYSAARRGVIYYAGLHYEPHGHLEFVHSETGVRTLRDEFDKVAAHNRHHLDQIHRALVSGRDRSA